MGKKILVADDEQDVCDLLEHALTDKGYEVISVNDGTKALEKLTGEPFDLAMLDVMMPGIDGYHLVYKITTEIDGPKPKIIIISSRDAGQDKHVGEQSGADAQLQKPFDMPKLIMKVEELIGPGAHKEQQTEQQPEQPPEKTQKPKNQHEDENSLKDRPLQDRQDKKDGNLSEQADEDLF